MILLSPKPPEEPKYVGRSYHRSERVEEPEAQQDVAARREVSHQHLCGMRMFRLGLREIVCAPEMDIGRFMAGSINFQSEANWRDRIYFHELLSWQQWGWLGRAKDGLTGS